MESSFQLKRGKIPLTVRIETFTQALDCYRASRGYTWADLAHRCGVGQSTMHRWRNDGVDRPQLGRLSIALELDATESQDLYRAWLRFRTNP